MHRRSFFGSLSATVAAILIGPSAAVRAMARVPGVVDTPGESGEIPSYFLESGELTPAEQRGIEELSAYQAQVMVGQSAIRPRGRPSKAATYRLIRWEGDIGNTPGSFRSALSVRPELKGAAAYGVNAQIIGFHPCSKDWPDKGGSGALTFEFRTRLMGEPLTWLYARQFDIDEDGYTNLGMEFVGERDSAPQPIITDQPTVDLRVQLMRLGGEGGFLKKVLRICSYVTGVATPAPSSVASTLSAALPLVRVPGMLQEGVALSQALVGGAAEDTPIWRSGFVSYALAEGGSRLGIAPGIWVVVDESREEDLRDVQVAEKGGQALLVRGGEILDVNHLVLDVKVSEATLPSWAYAASASGRGPQPGSTPSPEAAPEPGSERDIVPKEVPPKPPKPPTGERG